MAFPGEPGYVKPSAKRLVYKWFKWKYRLRYDSQVERKLEDMGITTRYGIYWPTALTLARSYRDAYMYDRQAWQREDPLWEHPPPPQDND